MLLKNKIKKSVFFLSAPSWGTSTGNIQHVPNSRFPGRDLPSKGIRGNYKEFLSHSKSPARVWFSFSFPPSVPSTQEGPRFSLTRLGLSLAQPKLKRNSTEQSLDLPLWTLRDEQQAWPGFNPGPIPWISQFSIPWPGQGQAVPHQIPNNSH